MRFFIAIIGLFVLCGCQGQKASEPQREAGAPFGDMWRPDDSRFTQREHEIVASARSYLDKQQKKPVDGYYKVEHTKDSYEVFVMFAAGHERGRPLFYPGGHCTVLLREDGSVIRVLPGA